MEKTWASGSLELLRHADSHMQLDSAFDSRIAFISIDNSVEITIRTFLSLPAKLSKIKITKKELEEAGNSFPKMTELLFDRASDRISGINEGDIEHYHRIRNKLYHDGTGLSVDKTYILAYKQIASILLDILFDVKVSSHTTEPTLENLILLWNETESLLKELFAVNNISPRYTYKWEEAMLKKILTIQDIELLTSVRMIRNSQVHSCADTLDKNQIAQGVEKAKKLIEKLKNKRNRE